MDKNERSLKQISDIEIIEEFIANPKTTIANAHGVQGGEQLYCESGQIRWLIHPDAVHGWVFGRWEGDVLMILAQWLPEFYATPANRKLAAELRDRAIKAGVKTRLMVPAAIVALTRETAPPSRFTESGEVVVAPPRGDASFDLPAGISDEEIASLIADHKARLKGNDSPIADLLVFEENGYSVDLREQIVWHNADPDDDEERKSRSATVFFEVVYADGGNAISVGNRARRNESTSNSSRKGRARLGEARKLED